MKRLTATLTTLPLLAAGLAACGEDEPEYAAICVDPNTEERLEDDACEEGDDDYLAGAVFWYLLASSSSPFPAVGEEVDDDFDFKKTKPAKAKIVTGLPKSGGSSLKSSYSKMTGGSSTKPGGTSPKAPAPKPAAPKPAAPRR